MRLFPSAICVAAGLLGTTTSVAMRSPAAVEIAEYGLTRVSTTGPDGVAIVAELSTRIATPVEATATRATRCSGGRVICSLVDRLTITVAGVAVDVPPRAVLDMADVDRAELRILGRDRYELALTCGDAAPAYQARLFFTRRRVDRLDLWSDEAGMIEQSTVFDDVSKAFR